MKTFKNLVVPGCVLAAGLLLSHASSANAQQEPHYLHALSELRTARDYIQYDKNPAHERANHNAVEEINKAIDEIKHAAWDDGKNTQFAPPAQGVTKGWAPIHYAFNFLTAAKADVGRGVDTPQNTGLRDRAIRHIDVAIIRMTELIQNQGAS